MNKNIGQNSRKLLELKEDLKNFKKTFSSFFSKLNQEKLKKSIKK